MLYPEQNDFRHLLDLSGLWDFQADPNHAGLEDEWFTGVRTPGPIAVPGSWTDQFPDLSDYFGEAWYVRRVYVPAGWQSERVFLRFGAVSAPLTLYLNGIEVGAHPGGCLPFDIEVGGHLQWGRENLIAIRMASAAAPTGDSPSAGLLAPVMLCTVPQTHIEDVTVVTGRSDSLHKVNGTIEISARLNQPIDCLATITLGLDQHALKTAMAFKGGVGKAKIFVPSPMFWSPDEPHLYDLTIVTEFDRCALAIGIRTIEVSDGQVLLNGEPIALTGFDFDGGWGFSLGQLVRLFGQIRAEGANSLRVGTSPLSDHALQLADRMGLMIIAELPSDPAQLAARHAHDKNHPSVIG